MKNDNVKKCNTDLLLYNIKFIM